MPTTYNSFLLNIPNTIRYDTTRIRNTTLLYSTVMYNCSRNKEQKENEWRERESNNITILTHNIMITPTVLVKQIRMHCVIVFRTMMILV